MKRLNLLFLFFLLTLACNNDEDAPAPQTAEPIKEEFKDFSSIKSDDWRSKIGQEITVEGYLIPVSKRIYKIVNDSAYAQLNTILPDDKYILAQIPEDDPHLDSYDQLMPFTGARIKATGLLADFKPRDKDGESMLLSSDLVGPKGLASITFKALPLETGNRRLKIASQNLGDIVDMQTLKRMPENPTKFALLYSGGVDAGQAYAYYYNNLRVMYELLLMQGYRPENIVVVYKEGVHESIVPSSLPPYFKYYPEIPVYQPATPDGLNNAIGYLKKAMQGKQAELFLMTTNHGGGYHAVKKTSSGTPDTNNDEPTSDMQGVDEIISYYNTSSVLTDEDFAAKVNTLPFVTLKALFLQCYSGGFLHDFKGPNRVLMSAASENEFSWGGGSMDLDTFFANFVTPVYLNSSSLLVDLNKDGKLTMNEIFLFARALQQAHSNKYPQYRETPQYDDDGNGVPNEPTATGFGSTVTL